MEGQIDSQMVPESRGSIQIILHSLRAQRCRSSREHSLPIKSHILKSTINDYFSKAERRCVCCVRSLVCVCVCVCQPGIVQQQQQQPLGLLRNAFEVNHNESLYLHSEPKGDLQTELSRTGQKTSCISALACSPIV